MSWYLECLKKYATFSGRARRKEYWMFTLFNIIFGFAAGFLSGLMGESGATLLAPIVLIYSLAIMVPGLAVTWRRLHDTDRSGWWFWVALVPFIGSLVLLYFLAQEGTKGSNQFGPDPMDPVGPMQVQRPQRTGAPVA